MKKFCICTTLGAALLVGGTSLLAATEADERSTQGVWAITVGVQADDQDARALQAGISYALSDSVWVSADAGVTKQATPPGEASIKSRSARLGFDYDFGRVGVQVDADYWGDPGELTRNGFVAGLYTSTDTARLSMQGYYRDYTLTARIADDQGNLSDVREFDMSSTGIGAALRLSNERWFGGLNAVRFDYSRDPRLFRSRAAYRALSLSALTLANSFVDYGAKASLGKQFDLKSLEVEIGLARSAVDDAKIRTLTIYFVTPLSERVDIEFSTGINDSNGFDSTYFGGVSLTWFGR